MRMRGMADAFTQQQEEPETTQLSFEERFALPVDRQNPTVADSFLDRLVHAAHRIERVLPASLRKPV